MTPYYTDDWLQILEGDCREVMASMEPESIHCVVTSPPYWGLRDYGTATWIGGNEGCDHVERKMAPSAKSTLADHGEDGRSPYLDNLAGIPFKGTCGKCGAIREDSQLGLEPTPEAYVANMVAVFREVKRVLRADGTVWLNLGDSYGTGASGGSVFDNGRTDGRTSYEADKPRGRIAQPRVPGLKPKDLVGIPWRVAFALQADGWYLRSDIIWSKPNPMPESVTDRPTKAHEYLFLLSKSPRYYYDADAVREPHDDKARPNGADGLPTRHGERDGLTVNAKPSQAWHSGGQGFYKSEVYYNPAGRNLRSVWTVATQPYPGAHFATFPEKLVEPCILAGTSAKGVCPECGAPWVREVERTFDTDQRDRILARRNVKHDSSRNDAPNHNMSGQELARMTTRTTTAWRPNCDHQSTVAVTDPRKPHGESGLFRHEHGAPCVVCDRQPVPATVLDPFAGSGTVGRVAARLSRRAVLIDLNAAYLGQAMKRNDAIPLGLETA
jgi:DNA modification methylase